MSDYELARQAIALLEQIQPPSPTPTSTVIPGIGTQRLGSTLSTTSNLERYALVVGDWADAAQLSTLPGLAFAYENLGPPGFAPLNLSDPAGFLWAVAALPANVHIYLDNCSVEQAATQLPFLRAVAPAIMQRRHLMLNANGYGGPGDNNNGESDRLWFAQLAGLATHLQSEFWMQGRGGSLVYKLRLAGSADYSDYHDEWLALVAAAHAAGCSFVGYTYGNNLGEGNAVYGRASLLTAPDFRDGDVFLFAAGTADGGRADPWGSTWTTGSPHPVVDPVTGTASL